MIMQNEEIVQVVIEIPLVIYNIVMNSGTFGRYRFNTTKAIRNGTPLEQIEKKYTGHWIDTDGGVECDKCGKWYPHAHIAKNTIKFCSECGAKMMRNKNG